MDSRVVNNSICKHGMSWEFCAICQKVEYTKMVKFPIIVTDEDGEEKRIFLHRKSKQVRYKRYR